MGRALYKKQRQQFDDKVRELLTNLGAKSDPTWNVPWSCYVLDTRAGKLRLSVHTGLYMCDKPWFRGDSAPWVASRFDDVGPALDAGLDVNKFSGKWNHHLWRNWTDSFDQGLALLEHDLRKIL